jgi:hypothetical protein
MDMKRTAEVFIFLISCFPAFLRDHCILWDETIEIYFLIEEKAHQRRAVVLLKKS